jgi:hypothetical protein
LQSCVGEPRLVFLFIRGLYDFCGEKTQSSNLNSNSIICSVRNTELQAMPRPDDLGWEQVDPEGVQCCDTDEKASDSGPKRALAGTSGHASTLQRRKCEILLRWTRLVRSSRLAQRLVEIGKLVLNPHVRPKDRK